MLLSYAFVLCLTSRFYIMLAGYTFTDRQHGHEAFDGFYYLLFSMKAYLS